MFLTTCLLSHGHQHMVCTRWSPIMDFQWAFHSVALAACSRWPWALCRYILQVVLIHLLLVVSGIRFSTFSYFMGYSLLTSSSPSAFPTSFFHLLIVSNPLPIFTSPTLQLEWRVGALWWPLTGVSECQVLLNQLLLLSKEDMGTCGGWISPHTPPPYFGLGWQFLEINIYWTNQLITIAEVLGKEKKKRWSRNMSRESLVFVIICIIVTSKKELFFRTWHLTKIVGNLETKTKKKVLGHVACSRYFWHGYDVLGIFHFWLELWPLFTCKWPECIYLW